MQLKQEATAQSVVIIGAGLAGLACAALLAKAGWQVTILEKLPTVGGRARVFKKKNYTFDMGPSWYLMPEVFERFFALFQQKVDDFYTLERLNPRYQLFFDNHKIVLHDNLGQNMNVFETEEPGAGQKLNQLLGRLERQYQAVTDSLIYQPLEHWRTFLSKKNLQDVFKMCQSISLWKNWDQEIRSYFSSARLQQILGFPAVFLGGSPFNVPSLYNLLIWADFGKGVWYPKGGMGKVVLALQKLAEAQGVKIVTESEVTKIQINDGIATGVYTGKTFWPANIVVGAADLPWMETTLLPTEYQTYPQSYWAKKKLAISALLLYVGVKKRLKGLTHHNIFFGANWKQSFEEIFEQKIVPKNPSFYLSVRSITDQSIVPKNHEELFVLVPLGSRTDYSTQELHDCTQTVLERIYLAAGENFSDQIEVKEIFTPKDFQQSYNAHQGTALGIIPTFWQSLWFRPQNKSRKVPNLFYTGQYTNPGIGMPMAIISSQITAQLIGKPKSNYSSIFRTGSTTYYYSSIFFTGETKQDVFTLYAYVRTIDNFVDQANPDLLSLERYWQETEHAWKQGGSKIQLVNEFILLAKRKHFDWQWIAAFWHAMRQDLDKKKYYSFSELEKYMYGSAEVIGLMMANILNLDEKAAAAACMQGKAMQFLNFIRDVQEDESLGRNYLGYEKEIKEDSQKWATFLRSQIALYRKLQKDAEKGYSFIPTKYLIPIKTASDMYTWTADQIEKNPEVVWQKKIKPHKRRVVLQALKNTIELYAR